MRAVEADFRVVTKLWSERKNYAFPLTVRFLSVGTKAINDFHVSNSAPVAIHTQSLHHLLSRLRMILILTVGLLAPFLTGHGPSHAPNQTLPRVAMVRDRALCARCPGENDNTFHFC